MIPNDPEILKEREAKDTAMAIVTLLGLWVDVRNFRYNTEWNGIWIWAYNHRWQDAEDPWRCFHRWQDALADLKQLKPRK